MRARTQTSKAAFAALTTAMLASTLLAGTSGAAHTTTPTASTTVEVSDASGDVAGTSDDAELKAAVDVTRVRYMTEQNYFDSRVRDIRFTVFHGPGFVKDEDLRPYAVTTFTANKVRYKAVYGQAARVGLFVKKDGAWARKRIPGQWDHGTGSVGPEGKDRLYTTEITLPAKTFKTIKQFKNLTTTLRVSKSDLKDSVAVSTQPLLMAPTNRH